MGWFLYDDIVLVFLLLTLNKFHTFFPSASNVDVEHVNISWVHSLYVLNKFYKILRVIVATTCTIIISTSSNFEEKYKAALLRDYRSFCKYF